MRLLCLLRQHRNPLSSAPYLPDAEIIAAEGIYHGALLIAHDPGKNEISAALREVTPHSRQNFDQEFAKEIRRYHIDLRPWPPAPDVRYRKLDLINTVAFGVRFRRSNS